MVNVTSRRAFLSGRMLQNDPEVMRPPGAVREAFLDLCTKCGDCASACPENIIEMDAGQRPVLQFQSGACTFCGDCANACESGALELAHLADWPWRAEVEDTCFSLSAISCRTCQDTCGEEAIRFQLKIGGCAEPILDTDTCTGCGACASACPAGAITFKRHEPAQVEAAG